MAIMLPLTSKIVAFYIVLLVEKRSYIMHIWLIDPIFTSHLYIQQDSFIVKVT